MRSTPSTEVLGYCQSSRFAGLCLDLSYKASLISTTTILEQGKQGLEMITELGDELNLSWSSGQQLRNPGIGTL